MNLRPSALLPLFAVLLVAPLARAADNAERACSALTVAADPGLRARLPALVERVESEFAARSDVDTCARVELSGNEEGISISVMLPDGRATSRRVIRAVDVLPTLEALLLVPEYARAEPPEVTPPVVAPAARRPAHARRELLVEHADAPDAAAGWRAQPRPRRLGIELSLITGARVGDGQFGVGAGVLSFLEVHGWLLGFEGRVDGYRTLSGSDPETVLELAALGGRRLHFDSVALDLSAGAALATHAVAFSETETVRVRGDAPPPPIPPRRERSSGPYPRLLLGARLGFSPRSMFRSFIGIDGEIGPTRSDADAGDSARLPAYAVGLALGATVGTP